MARESSLQPGRNQPPRARPPWPGCSAAAGFWGWIQGRRREQTVTWTICSGIDLWPGVRRGPGGCGPLSAGPKLRSSTRFPVETSPVAWAIAVLRISGTPVDRLDREPSSRPMRAAAHLVGASGPGGHPGQEPLARGGRHWWRALPGLLRHQEAGCPVGHPAGIDSDRPIRGGWRESLSVLDFAPGEWVQAEGAEAWNNPWGPDGRIGAGDLDQSALASLSLVALVLPMPYLRMKRSTRPSVSRIFWVPV